MAAVEASARGAFVSEVVRSASAMSVWAPARATAGASTRSNRLARQVALVEVLLSEVAEATEGEAGATELQAAVLKLLPKLLPALGLDQGEGLSPPCHPGARCPEGGQA
jgi:hypothetical protein